MIDLAKPPANHRAWAHKILAKHRKGERVPGIALDMAREALGITEPPKRQPGEDDA
jgi:hypothetical protein